MTCQQQSINLENYILYSVNFITIEVRSIGMVLIWDNQKFCVKGTTLPPSLGDSIFDPFSRVFWLKKEETAADRFLRPCGTIF